MVVKMQAVAGSTLLQYPLVMLEDVVIADIPAARILVVVDMIHAEPVVYPSLACEIQHLIAERIISDPSEHGIDLFPCVVVGEQVGIKNLLDSRLDTMQVKRSSLQFPQRGIAWLEVEMEDFAEAFERCCKGLMQRALGIDAMDNVYRSWGHGISSLYLSFDSDRTGRNADDYARRGNIRENDRTRANNRLSANVNALDNGRTGAHMCARPHMHTAT